MTNIKKLKDFAELSSDELIGGMDEIKGKRIKINGYLEDFALTREEVIYLLEKTSYCKAFSRFIIRYF